MPSLRPHKRYKRGLSDQICRAMAERFLRSPKGQDALRQGWASRLHAYVMDWGSTPTRPETIEALKRAANEFWWDLEDLRRVANLDDTGKAGLRCGEAMLAREAELKKKFLRD